MVLVVLPGGNIELLGGVEVGDGEEGGGLVLEEGDGVVDGLVEGGDHGQRVGEGDQVGLEVSLELEL